jgi:23S rRNA (uracil1939-C5)-methyltransferase
MRKKRAPRLVEVTIESLSKKGNGQGAVTLEEGKTFPVEVPFTMPGDKVHAYLYHKKGGVFQGKLDEIVTASDLRVAPRCAHFSECGGCRWQHVSYEEQTRIKREAVIKHFSTLIDSESEVSPIVVCKTPWEYRNKMEFTFSTDKADNQYLGLIKSQSKGRVLNLTECHLTSPWFTEALEATRNWWKGTDLRGYHAFSDKGALRTLTVREGKKSGDRLVVLTVSGNSEFSVPKEDLNAFVEAIKEAVTPEVGHLSILLRIQQIAKGMSTNFFEMPLFGPGYFRESLTIQPFDEAREFHFKVGPISFFQPNPLQAELLFSESIRAAKLSKEHVVYDLYCGTGTIGICMAPFVKQVIGVEISPESAGIAQENARLNSLQNYTVFSGAVRYVLGQVVDSFPFPDVVVVDPPRAGLDKEVIEKLIDVKPKKIIYISCNPASQVGDVALLVNGGYKISAIQPVDQFPHTPHIENIVVLSCASN